MIGAIRRTALVAVTVGAAGIAAGCGGDDGGADEPGSSKEQYIATANAICVESRSEAEAVFKEVGFSGRPTPVAAQRALKGLLPVMRKSFGGRAALDPPEGEDGAIEAIDAAGRTAVAEFERIAADRSESAALMSGQTPDPATEVDRLSGEYGIDECAGVD